MGMVTKMNAVAMPVYPYVGKCYGNIMGTDFNDPLVSCELADGTFVERDLPGLLLKELIMRSVMTGKSFIEQDEQPVWYEFGEIPDKGVYAKCLFSSEEFDAVHIKAGVPFDQSAHDAMKAEHLVACDWPIPLYYGRM